MAIARAWRHRERSHEVAVISSWLPEPAAPTDKVAYFLAERRGPHLRAGRYLNFATFEEFQELYVPM
jgi:hypothetical protein